MNKELSRLTEQWKQMERKTEQQRRLADAFYETDMMRLIEEDFIARNREQVFEQADCFIVSVGTSYEPIVLNMKLFQPDRILFLYTEKTEDVLYKIVTYCKLEPDSYEKNKVSERDPLDIYREIKRQYLEWDKPKKIYIDFTGGTKAMSAAAAMAGAMIDIQLVYVGTRNYMNDFRKPEPGSETLFYISNPLAVFGDLEIEKAFALFEKYNYAGAQEKLAILKESIPDPDTCRQLHLVYLLSKAYEAWDALDFLPAYEHMSALNKQLRRDRKQHQKFLMMDFCTLLEQQEVILSYLKEIPPLMKNKKNIEILKNKDIITALMFTMCQNGLVREQQEKYDMATLLFYRLLEMIEQRRLAEYNLFVSGMNYKKVKYNLKRTPEFAHLSSKDRYDLLKQKVCEIKKQLFGTGESPRLQKQVSLMEGFVILYALGDPIAADPSGESTERLKQIRKMVFLRNHSIFAHGLGPVGFQDFHKFQCFVLDLFQLFCSLEQISYQEYRENMTWVNPLTSKYYTGMGE